MLFPQSSDNQRNGTSVHRDKTDGKIRGSPHLNLALYGDWSSRRLVFPQANLPAGIGLHDAHIP
jgi:hypothetical protein